MTLHYSETQILIGIVFAVVVAALMALFVVVGLNSRREIPFPLVQSTGYWIRRRWLILLIALLVVVVGSSLFELPYSTGAGKVVKARAIGGQFYWSISPSNFTQGDTVRFEVTSGDVNHGFGLYSPAGKMLGSVQAMPGYTNRLTVSLDQPGTYHVECLEFCGIGHHKLQGEFEVMAR